MGNLAKETRLRNEGLDMALRIVAEHGIEGLAEEVKKRGAYGTAANIPASIIKKTTEEIIEHTSILNVAISIHILRELLYFNESQINDFKIAYSNMINLCSDDEELVKDIIDKADLKYV